MPRLKGYMERIDATLFDAFAPRDMLAKPGVQPFIRLFGNRNIGDCARTNLLFGGQLPCDQTFLIVEWYARTNISELCSVVAGSPYPRAAEPSADLVRSWDAWANATIVELMIGMKPVATRPLVELFGPRMFDSPHGRASDVDVDDALAERLWRRGQTPPQDLLVTPVHVGETFSDLPRTEKDRWRSAASVYPFRRPIPIPVRQCFGVQLRSDERAMHALLRHLPDRIAPQPLVWVHLDGLLARHVA